MATKEYLDRLAGVNAPGASATAPTHPPARAPKMYRGTVIPNPRVDAAGADVPLTGYADNGYSGPASVGVAQSGGDQGRGLCDFDTTIDDPVKAGLAAGGMSDRSGELAKPIVDLERKIDLTGFPAAHGMRNRSNEGGKI